MDRITRSIIGFFALFFSGIGFAGAQTYPVKPIHIIVPYPSGAILDATARTLSQEVSDAIRLPVLVENRPGASAIIGMQACAKAPPDGYTLCLTTNDGLSYNPHVFMSLPYDPDADFAPIINLAWVSSMLVAKANAPFNTFKEMISFSKSKPGAVNWGTWGAATLPDVFLQWIKHSAGVNITAVPYKGGAQTVPALLAGEIDITFIAVGPLLSQVRAGKVKPIAIVGNRRSPFLPNVPNLAEEGADPGLPSWFGLFAPAATAKPVIERLNALYAKSLAAPRVQEFFRAQTLEAVGGSPEEFSQFLKADRANAGRVFKMIGIKPTPAP